MKAKSRCLWKSAQWTFIALALSCVPSGGFPGRQALPAAEVKNNQEADVALQHALDRYIVSFGAKWGEAAAFNGYVAVARDGRMVFGKGYGSPKREGPTGAGPDTLFRIASVSKVFTTVGILQLEERGLLSIDDPVRKYLPELAVVADAITIRHCLTHSSGLPPFADDSALAAETGKPHSFAKVLASYLDKPLQFRPGDRFEYSNAGFILLGAILERVSGQSYESYFKEHVFRPAGMLQTTTVSDPPPPGLAVGYFADYSDAVTPAAPVGSVITFGCGSVLSSANDLIAWDRALNGPTLLSEASKRRMYKPERDPGAIFQGRGRMGLGWFIAQDRGAEFHWHGGGLPGFLTSFTSIPEARLTVVVLSNLFSDYELDRKIAVAAEQLALKGVIPLPEQERSPLPLTATELAELDGDYLVDAATRDTLHAKFAPWLVERWAGLTLTPKDGHLMMRWAGQDGPEVFRSEDGTFFTKQIGLLIVPEPIDGGNAKRAVRVLKKSGVDRRYVRLSNAIDLPAGASCPAGMVRLGPDGKSDADRDGAVGAFCLDVTEVTVGAYSDCVSAGRCRPAPTTVSFEGLTPELAAKWNPSCNGTRKDRLAHPINCIDWQQATAYCRAQGKRLPTEAEWEWAAHGGAQNRKFPWGFREPDAQLCWSGHEKRSGTCPVSSFRRGDGLGGVHDLAGNVEEWTSTASENGHVAMSGGWNMSDDASALSATSETAIATFRGPSVGFRCAR